MKTTIQLDDALAHRLRDLVPPRGLNRFINDVLSEKVDALERQQLETEMIEGYIATREDRAALNADWQIVDGEGWPE